MLKLSVSLSTSAEEAKRRNVVHSLLQGTCLLFSTPEGRSTLCKQGGKSAKTPVASIVRTTPADKPKGLTRLQLPASGQLTASLLRALTSEGEGGKPSCPWLEYKRKKEEWLKTVLPVDCLGVFLRSAHLEEVQESLLKAVSNQLCVVLQRLAEEKSLKKVTCLFVICANASNLLFTVFFAPQGTFSVKIYHFPVPLQSVPITVVYECEPHTTHLEATSELMQANTVCRYKYCFFCM